MAEKAKKDNFLTKVGRFFKSLATEMKKVSWPSGKQVFTSTLSVIVYCAIIACVIALLDFVVGTALLDWTLGLR